MTVATLRSIRRARVHLTERTVLAKPKPAPRLGTLASKPSVPGVWESCGDGLWRFRPLFSHS